MTQVLITRSKLDSLATAISAKSGEPLPLTIAEMEDAVDGIDTGGSGSAYQDADGYIVLSDDESTAPQGNISITENGVYDVESYAAATVDVSGGGGPYEPRLDGKTHVWVHIEAEPYVAGLYVTNGGGGNIDWGDGSESALSPGTVTHAYQQAGVYEMTLPAGAALGVMSNLAWKYRGLIEAVEFVQDTAGTTFFADCYGLKWLYQASGTVSHATLCQNDYALQYCRINSATTVADNAFDSCYSLRRADFPSAVTSIGNSAFRYCRSLESITIPATVTSIGNSAFQYCPSMLEYHVLPTTPPSIGTNAFYVSSNVKIYVPAASLSAYQSAWSAYSSYLVGE